jgi:tetratricopeptide (TPR) repeat protein
VSERRIGLGIAGGLFLVVFVAYLETMAGSTSFWDSGEFIATSYTLGIPHPPATPLYVVLGRVFTLLPLPLSIAQKVNMMSALFGALSVTVLFLLIVDLIKSRRGAPQTWIDRVVVYGCGLVGALFTAWSNTFWTNAVEAEVYSISSFVMGSTTLLARRWSRAPASPQRTNDIYLIIYLLSLGVGFHLGTVLTYPAIALYCLLFREKSFKNADLVVFSFGFFLFLAFVNLKFGGPLAVVALLIFLVGVAVRASAGHRFALVSTGLFVLGVTIHLFLLIRSGQNPAIDEANPETWSNLMAVLRREQYPPGNLFVRKASWHFQVIDHFWRYFKEQYELMGPGGRLSGQGLALFPIAIGLAGMFSMFRSDRRSFLLVFVTFLITSFGMIVFLNFSDSEVRERDYFYSPAFYFFGVFIGVGSAALLDWFFVARAGERRARLDAVGSVAGVAILLVLTCMLYARYHFSHDRTNERVPWGYGYNMLAGLEPNAIIFTNGDNDTFPLWYQQEVEGFRRDVRVANLSLLQTPWYVQQLKDNEPKVALSWTDAQIANLGGYIDRDGRIVQPRDQAVNQIVLDNYGKRPIYFAVTIPRDNMEMMEEYLVLEGLVYKATHTRGRDRRDIAAMKRNAEQVYRYDGILTADGKHDSSVYLSQNERNLIMNYANPFMRLAQHSEQEGDRALGQVDPKLLQTSGDLEARGNPVAMRHYEDAERYIRKAIEIAPEFDLLYAQMGSLLIKMGRSAEALELYRRLYAQHPNDERWLFQIVQGLFAIGADEEGLAKLQELVQRMPDEEYVYQYYVQILEEMGRPADANRVVAEWESRHPAKRSVREYLNAVRSGIVDSILGVPLQPPPVAPESAVGR